MEIFLFLLAFFTGKAFGITEENKLVELPNASSVFQIEEDSPYWMCETMGNKKCNDEPNYLVKSWSHLMLRPLEGE